MKLTIKILNAVIYSRVCRGNVKVSVVSLIEDSCSFSDFPDNNISDDFSII